MPHHTVEVQKLNSVANEGQDVCTMHNLHGSSFFFTCHSRTCADHVSRDERRPLVTVIQHYEDDRKQEILEIHCKQRASRCVWMDCLV